ncbi:MAG: sulfatase-like hydrolase/transferase [Thermoguttaceae bacterium]
MNFLVISIDGLHSGMIGALGNTWIQTPELDDIAAHGLVLDRYYTESLDLKSIFNNFWTKNHLLSHLASHGFRSVLLTDQSDVFLHEKAADFSERHYLAPPESEIANSFEETAFCKGIACTIDLLESHRTSQSLFLWTHLGGFRDKWDFPLEYRQKHRGEEDPVPYLGTTPPFFRAEKFEPFDPDRIQSVFEAYSGGVSVLDEAMAGLCDYLDNDRWRDNTCLIFVSTRGFALGEHDIIGCDNRFYSESIHLPLLICWPQKIVAPIRSSVLINSSDLNEFFISSINSRLGRIISGETETGHQQIHLASSESKQIHRTFGFSSKNDSDEKFLTDENRVFIAESAVITSEWFLKQIETEIPPQKQIELFVKPDDRWDVNNVANRCQEIVAELLWSN